MNIYDHIIIGLVAVALFFAVIRTVRKKGGCSCGCEGCKKSCARVSENGEKSDK